MHRPGAGLTTFLLERGEWEIDRPTGPPGPAQRGQNHELNAVRTARDALSPEHVAVLLARGNPKAMRVLLAAHMAR